MSLLPNDIKDDEIRIISSERNLPVNTSKREELKSMNKPEKPKWKIWVIITAILFFGGMCVFFWWEVKSDTLPEEKEHLQITTLPINEEGNVQSNIPVPKVKPVENGFVQTFDTILNKEKFTVFIPHNLVPELKVGVETLKDTTAKFVVQAADIRKDNGGIVGAYVYKGNLLSKGQAKAGFCAIIDGKAIVGVAESTPYLEQAIESDGYFFRQYPLVVEGQPVNNRLKYSSLRKALAELNGETVVIMSHNRMTLNEFSQYLVDMGVKNAIYLVGSSSFGFAIDDEGNRIEFGKEQENPSINTNYIIWK